MRQFENDNKRLLKNNRALDNMNPSSHITRTLILRSSLVAVLVLCIAEIAWGQATIVADGLNNSSSLFTLSNGAYYTGNSGTGALPASSPFAVEGTHSRGASNTTATLTSNANINTSGYLNITLSLRVAAFSLTTTNGLDGTDYFRIEISPNGGANWYNTVEVLGNNNAYWAYATGVGNAATPYDGDASTVQFAPAGSGNRTTDGYGTITITQLPAVSNLRVRITMFNNSANERWLVDDFKIQGTAESKAICTGTPSPGNTLTTDNLTCPSDAVTLSLQNSFTTTGITYLWQTSPDNSTWTNSTPVFITSDFASQPANTNVYGDATVTGGVLRLTQNVGSLTGGFVIQTTPGSNITPFTATFDYRIFDGSGADGMSLSYASNINNDAGPGEEGEGSGIILKLDTYDNGTGTGTNSQIRINFAGSQVWSNVLGAYNLRNTSYRTVRMTVDNDGYLTLTIGGTMIVNALLLPGYAAADKSNWKFKFSARTGGATDQHSVDNLKIQYGNNATLAAAPIVTTYYRCLVTCATTNLTGTSNSVLVNVNPTPTFTTSIFKNVSCYGGSDGQINITMTSSNKGPYTYSLNNGVSYIGTLPGSYPNYSISGLTATTHKIRIKDANECESANCP